MNFVLNVVVVIAILSLFYVFYDSIKNRKNDNSIFIDKSKSSKNILVLYFFDIVRRVSHNLELSSVCFACVISAYTIIFSIYRIILYGVPVAEEVIVLWYSVGIAWCVILLMITWSCILENKE